MAATRSKRSVQPLFTSDFQYQFPVMAFPAELAAAKRDETHSNAMETQISEATQTVTKEKQATLPGKIQDQLESEP